MALGLLLVTWPSEHSMTPLPLCLVPHSPGLLQTSAGGLQAIQCWEDKITLQKVLLPGRKGQEKEQTAFFFPRKYIGRNF